MTKVRPKLVDSWDKSFSSIAGPIAEAVWSLETTDDPQAYFSWSDHFTGALLAGGHGDLEGITPGVVDNEQVVEFIRDQIMRDWSRIIELAELLADMRTVDGWTAALILRGERE
jgi:hypothetical protein